MGVKFETLKGARNRDTIRFDERVYVDSDGQVTDDPTSRAYLFCAAGQSVTVAAARAAGITVADKTPPANKAAEPAATKTTKPKK